MGGANDSIMEYHAIYDQFLGYLYDKKFLVVEISGIGSTGAVFLLTQCHELMKK